MIRTQKNTFRLNRRAALRGLGAAVALPFLDVMRAPGAHAQDARGPARFVGFYMPCGVHMANFTPSALGSNFALPPILQSMAAILNKMLVVSGLNNNAAVAQEGDGPGDHARGTASFLTASNHKRSTIYNGVSLDQLVAQHHRGQTRLPSLELGAEKSREAGTCDSAYSCAYTQNIAWADARTPLPKEIDPRRAFDRLFAGVDINATEEQITKRRRYEQSILDFVKDDTVRLQSRLGAQDTAKLDQYFTGVRELERRVETLGEIPNCSIPERPTGIAPDPTDYMHQLADLIVLAFQCDLTRSETFMAGNAVSDRAYCFLGHAATHHEYSHHQNDPDKLAALTAIDTWQVSIFARIMSRLDAIDDGGWETMLDHTIGVVGSELTDGDRHNHDLIPMLVAGRGVAAERLVTGQHVTAPPGTSMGDFYLTVLSALGIERERFGDDGRNKLTAFLAA